MRMILLSLLLIPSFAVAEVDFISEIAPTFEERCVWCHSVGGHQAGGLFLETYHAEENLVSMPSSQKDGAVRVIPKDIENSYLMKKLRGDLDIVGARMPPGFYPPLEKPIMEKIKEWIMQLPLESDAQ